MRLKASLKEGKETKKRFPLNHLNKLYQLEEEDAVMIDHPPVVDVAVVRLAKKRNLTHG